jgi:hypothetical protein
VDPAEEPKLLLEVTLLERHDKAHEADCIERKTDNTMVGSERKQLPIGENNMLEMRLSTD